MNILISGGSGLIGTALAKQLAESGHNISSISRSSQTQPPGHPAQSWISWELDDLIRALDRTDVVINLAGTSISGPNPLLMRWTKKRKEQIIESRLRAGTLLSEAIAKSTNIPEVFIQASAIGYYGNTGPGPIDESAQPGSDFLASVCKEWERSTKSIEELGVRRITARIGLVFSDQGGLLDLLKLPFLLFVGGKIGSGKQYLSWIHIDDLVKGLVFLINNSQTQGVFNLTAPLPVQNQEFARVIGEVVNRPSWLAIPSILLKLFLGEAATLALDGRSVFPKRLLDAGYVFQFDRVESALSNLLN